jgi:hypothetical protein
MGAPKPAGFRGTAKLSEAEAEELTAEIVERLTSAYRDVAPLIVRAFRGRAWVAVGNTSWDEYCHLNFRGPRMLRFSDEQLTELCTEFAGEGMSVRAIGSALGIGHATAARKVNKGGDRPAEVIGLDDRRQRRDRTAPAPKAAEPAGKTMALTDRIVVALAAAGEQGLTADAVCANVWEPRERVSPALCRLYAARRIDYRRPEHRGQFGTYVRTEEA